MMWSPSSHRAIIFSSSVRTSPVEPTAVIFVFVSLFGNRDKLLLRLLVSRLSFLKLFISFGDILQSFSSLLSKFSSLSLLIVFKLKLALSLMVECLFESTLAGFTTCWCIFVKVMRDSLSNDFDLDTAAVLNLFKLFSLDGGGATSFGLFLEIIRFVDLKSSGLKVLFFRFLFFLLPSMLFRFELIDLAFLSDRWLSPDGDDDDEYESVDEAGDEQADDEEPDEVDMVSDDVDFRCFMSDSKSSSFARDGFLFNLSKYFSS